MKKQASSNANGVSMADFSAKHDPSPEIRDLRSQVSRLEQQLSTEKQERGKVSNIMSDVLAAIPHAAPTPIVYKPQGNGTKSKVVFVAHATDWHIGETTLPQYIEEFGAFNYALACERVQRWIGKLLDKLAVVRTGYTCDECVVIGTADWISGDIHEELIRCNEFPCPEQSVRAGFLLGDFLKALAPHFKSVRAEILTAGNHDRVTKKPQSEQGGINSWGFVVTHIAQQYVKDIPNIEYRMHLGAKAIVNVSGTQYLIMHGDGIPAHMGVPHFGMDRLVMREFLARAKMLPERQFDAVVCGHWHCANNLMFCRYGGSLSGTTAHDHKFGRHGLPHQTSWLVHEKHGEFDWTRWQL